MCRQAATGERVEDPRGVGVVPDEHREVAQLPLGLDRRVRDPVGHRLGLLCPARELEVVDLDGIAGWAAPQLLVDTEPVLQPVGVVPDERVGRVEERLAGPPVLHQRDHLGVGVGRPKRVEVRERRAAPGEDGLVVVSDHRQVAVRRDQALDELELGVVGVLELVDQDVPVALGEPARRPGVVPQDPQGQGDLVAEVDDPRPLLQCRVCDIGRRELGLGLGFVAGGVVTGVVRHLAGEGHVVLRGDVVVAGAREEVEEGAHVPDRVAGGPVALERQVRE